MYVHVCLLLLGVQFLFIPSQAITTQQTAVYKCSVDNNGVSIQWKINGNVYTNSSDTHLGITISGTAHNSCLTIPGNPKLNNTIVRCVASGYLKNGGNYIDTTSATLFIQGMVIDVM